jgi:hypothetical protein
MNEQLQRFYDFLFATPFDKLDVTLQVFKLLFQPVIGVVYCEDTTPSNFLKYCAMKTTKLSMYLSDAPYNSSPDVYRIYTPESKDKFQLFQPHTVCKFSRYEEYGDELYLAARYVEEMRSRVRPEVLLALIESGFSTLYNKE